MGQNGGKSAWQAQSIPPGPIILSLFVPAKQTPNVQNDATLIADMSEVCEPFRTKLVATERGRNKLSNATSFVLNSSVVQKL